MENPIFIYKLKINVSKLYRLTNPEITLWNKLKAGDMASLGGLYDLFADDLYAYGTRFTSDKFRIMDVIHDLFLDLYKYRKNLASTDNVKYYLLRSLRNKLVKNNQSKVISLEEDYKLSEIKNSSSSYEEEIIQKEHVQEQNGRLTHAMSKLSDIQKEGLFLRYNQESSYEEISNIMGVSIETSRTTIYRAIRSLRAEMLLLLLLLCFLMNC